MKKEIVIGNPNPTPKYNIGGVEMITAKQIGEIIGTNNKSHITRFIAKADLDYVAVDRYRYYSYQQVIDHIRYGSINKQEIRDVLATIKELKNK